MAMKTVLLAVAIVLALGQVTDQSCKRSHKKMVSALISKARCHEPHLSLVPLPIPDGYDYVQPSVVKLHQCSGLHCNSFPEQCLPEPGNTTTYKFKAEAKTRNGAEMKCIEVLVEEHHSCQCGCRAQTCPDNKVFSAGSCKCVCDPDQRATCDKRRIAGDRVMWSDDRCTCLCDTTTVCDSSRSYWDPNACRCVNM